MPPVELAFVLAVLTVALYLGIELLEDYLYNRRPPERVRLMRCPYCETWTEEERGVCPYCGQKIIKEGAVTRPGVEFLDLKGANVLCR